MLQIFRSGKSTVFPQVNPQWPNSVDFVADFSMDYVNLILEKNECVKNPRLCILLWTCSLSTSKI